MKTSFKLQAIVSVAVAAVAVALGAGLAAAKAVDSLSTGVGIAERTVHKEYSVLLMFAEVKGPYLANIAVEIKDAEGKVVLDAPSVGPWLFAKLPAGDYKVVATRPSGVKTGAAFTVTADRQVVVRMTW